MQKLKKEAMKDAHLISDQFSEELRYVAESKRSQITLFTECRS